MSKTPPKRSDNGKIIECKFCRRAVWMNLTDHRVFEIVGDELHVDNCPRRQAHFKGLANNAAENQRKARGT